MVGDGVGEAATESTEGNGATDGADPQTKLTDTGESDETSDEAEARADDPGDPDTPQWAVRCSRCNTIAGRNEDTSDWKYVVELSVPENGFTHVGMCPPCMRIEQADADAEGREPAEPVVPMPATPAASQDETEDKTEEKSEAEKTESVDDEFDI